jgi:polyisoprenoid-binding protein YceI
MSQIQRELIASPVPGTWEVDPDHSNVEFVARHLFSKVRGRFGEFRGAITIGSEPEDSSVEVTIRATSIDTNHEERDEHLRNPDFLDVERFPTIQYRSRSVSKIDDGRFRVDGELTIRDVTRPVPLTVEYLGSSDDPWGGTRAGFSARTEINRDDFGASWNVVLETGGLLVGKTVQVELEIEAVLQRD